MADLTTEATLKSVRTIVLNQLSSHNAIDEADRDGDWQTMRPRYCCSWRSR
jgi:hypothetical protein